MPEKKNKSGDTSSKKPELSPEQIENLALELCADVEKSVRDFIKQNPGFTEEHAINSLTQLQISKNISLRAEKTASSIYCVALMSPIISINNKEFLLVKVGLTQQKASEGNVANSPRLRTLIKEILGALIQLEAKANKTANETLKQAKAEAWKVWKDVMDCQVWPVSRTDTMPLLEIEENIRFRVGIPIPKKLVHALPVSTEWVLTLKEEYETKIMKGVQVANTSQAKKHVAPEKKIKKDVQVANTSQVKNPVAPEKKIKKDAQVADTSAVGTVAHKEILEPLNLTSAWKSVQDARFENGKAGYTHYDKVNSALKSFENSVEKCPLSGALADQLRCPDVLRSILSKSSTPQ